MLRMLACLLVLSAATARAENVPAAPKKDEKICKRITETGTRVGGTRVYKTAEEWQRDAEAAQATTRRMQTNRGATKGG
ncbi:MAG: hypothetical protein FJX59_01350 [Alphaproteobacteria bacterium]|nr:hypothetical protein [Alphaproteobacteria bacterium]